MSTAARNSSSEGPGTVASRSRESGFTLVEMLIGVVLTGVVGAALVGVLIEQSSFYQENSRLVTANRSLRGSADRMSTELRTVHQGDVQTADSRQLTVRLGVMHGVVCYVSGTNAYIYLHRVPDSQPQTVRYMEPRFMGSWQTGLVWGDLQSDGSSTCASYGAPSGKSAGHYRKVTSWPVASPEVGTLVYGTRSLTYEFDERDGQIVLLRNNVEIAGPFERVEQYFRYYRQDGTEVTGGSLDDIAYVRIDATALGHDPTQRFEGDRTIDLRVPFRN